MSNLQYRQTKIQEKRKTTLFRDFVMEIWSNYGMVLYKENNLVSRYLSSDRIWKIVESLTYETIREWFTQSGVDYDDSKTFFDQIKILKQTIEFPNLSNYGWTENCEYADSAHNTKNAYLTFNTTWDNENILYSACIKWKCTNIYNSVMVWDGCNNIYFCNGIIRSYNVFYSKYILNSNNIWFSTNLNWCSDCIFCEWLDNQKYCIRNEQYEKDQYHKEKNKILSQRDAFLTYYQSISSKGNNFGSSNSGGSFVVWSEDVVGGSLSYHVKSWNNIVITWSPEWSERMYDVFIGWSGWSTDMYWCCMVWAAHHIYIGESIGMSSNIYYSFNIQDCSFCLGCIWLKNKSYCILNKQYTKEDWYEKVDEIFWQMEQDGILWQFFPASMNPFYFNDTAAYLIDPTFTKEEVTAKWYLRRDEPITVDIPEGAAVAKTSELGQFESTADWEWNINISILKKIIQDEQGNVYRIVPMEYEFLMKYWLPLPRKHWLDRMKENFRTV